MLIVRDFLADQTVRRSPDARENPTVSVVLPTYCRRASLKRAVGSVLSQSFADFELLVMDDGSTDGTDDLIEEIRAGDPRVVHVRHERNSGLPALRVNEGIELARGRYLAFQFDDDYWRPHALQVLVAEAARHTEPAVVAGHSILRTNGRKRSLPQTDVQLHTLNENNQLSNNSVLLPRHLVEQYGMYDCHVGMRRLCDWDLWLRYIRHVPFIVVDDIVAEAQVANPDSIGVTVAWDLPLFRYLHEIPRNHLLTPERWRDYQVDGLRIGEVESDRDFRRRLYEEHLVPYYLKFRHRFPDLEGFSGTLPQPRKTVLYIRNWSEPTHEIAFNHYDPVSNSRGNYKAYYQQVTQATEDWQRDADQVLLVRSVEDRAKTLMHQALETGTPVGLYLDDDLLTFHEFGPEFDYLAPGTPLHKNLSEMLRQVDAVWSTTDFIRESVQPLNPRLVAHTGCVPESWLPQRVRPRDPQSPLRIGYAGTSYRLEEFSQLWEALLRLSREYTDRLIFEFWGLDVGSLPALGSPVVHRPYVSSYLRYIEDLRRANFDVMLMPLLDHPRPRLGKAPSKYYQSAVAGALGIFSNVPQYAELAGGFTCLKPDNNVTAWYEALREAVAMPPAQLDLMRQRMLEHVREEFTEKAQIHKHEAAWRATEFHAKTRALRHPDGRPRVVYFLHSANFAGGELQLWRRLRLARSYGIEPIVVLPKILAQSESAQGVAQGLAREGLRLEFADYTCLTEPRSPSQYHSASEREDVRRLLQRCRPALVHSVTFIPSVGQVCEELGIPHVASLYAVDDGFAWPKSSRKFKHCAVVQSDSLRYAARWGDLLGAERFCAREVTPDAVFALGQQRQLERLGQSPSEQAEPLRMVVSGTLQERKRQLQTIEAAGRLAKEGWRFRLDLFGYTHFFPKYVNKCEKSVRAHGLEDCVTFRGFCDDVLEILGSADVVLSLSTVESFPSAIKEAMAAGLPVVATPVGGVSELIVDGVSGILCSDTSVEAVTDGIRRALTLTPSQRRGIGRQARRVARSEFHPQRAASDLLLMYNRTIDLTSSFSPPLVHGAGQTEAYGRPRRLANAELPQGMPGSSVPVNGGLSYRLTPERQPWTGLDVLVGTHQRPASGRLTLHVCSANGRSLRETTVDLAEARDNQPLAFRFDPISNAVGVPFDLKFSVSQAGPDTRISLFENNPPENKLRRGLRRAGVRLRGNSLYCRMCYTS